jgi:hypothetical protein
MAGTIQIKRSANTAAPSTLEFGELAWSSNGQILTIGREKADTANTIAVGGARTPGTLIANQALVANSSSSINEIKAANVYFDTIKQDVNTEANITMTATSTANLYNVHFRGNLKDENGVALQILYANGDVAWG